MSIFRFFLSWTSPEQFLWYLQKFVKTLLGGFKLIMAYSMRMPRSCLKFRTTKQLSSFSTQHVVSSQPTRSDPFTEKSQLLIRFSGRHGWGTQFNWLPLVVLTTVPPSWLRSSSLTSPTLSTTGLETAGWVFRPIAIKTAKTWLQNSVSLRTRT